MANHICDKLIREQWQKYTDASIIPHVGGIYVIGVLRPGRRNTKYIYLGHSKDVHIRIQQHKYGQQKIDGFVKRSLKRNGGKNLRVKWVKDRRHRINEGLYITCMENKLHYRLKYNMKGAGNN